MFEIWSQSASLPPKINIFKSHAQIFKVHNFIKMVSKKLNFYHTLWKIMRLVVWTNLQGLNIKLLAYFVSRLQYIIPSRCRKLLCMTSQKLDHQTGGLTKCQVVHCPPAAPLQAPRRPPDRPDVASVHKLFSRRKFCWIAAEFE